MTSTEAQATDAQKIEVIATEIMGWTPTYRHINNVRCLSDWRKHGAMVVLGTWNPLTEEIASAYVFDRLSEVFPEVILISKKDRDITYMEVYYDKPWPPYNHSVEVAGVTDTSRRRAVAECAYAVAVGMQATREREGT